MYVLIALDADLLTRVFDTGKPPGQHLADDVGRVMRRQDPPMSPAIPREDTNHVNVV